jgi:hypothetical protein
MNFHHLLFALAVILVALGAAFPKGGRSGGKSGSPLDGGVPSTANKVMAGEVIATALFVTGMFVSFRRLQL